MTFQLADGECLATVLDALDLDDRDRMTLHAIFALAGLASESEKDGEVVGYAIQDPTFGLPTDALSTGVVGSFTGGQKHRSHGGIEVQPWQIGVSTPDP